MQVDVYWNLNRDTYSIRCKGKVIGYADSVRLVDARFVVQPAGRDKVRRDRCKLVHAWVKGTLASDVGTSATPTLVTYNPYLHETFVRRTDQSPIAAARVVKLETREGKAWVSCAE